MSDSPTTGKRRTRLLAPSIWIAVILVFGGGVVVAALINLTMQDFYLRGTQAGTIGSGIIVASSDCMECHAGMDPINHTDPHSAWKGSLMANAARDPLFFAQMTNANQDVSNAGYFCMRCHIPMSFVSGHATDPSGNSLNSKDIDGVTCNFCHCMVDPIYRPGISPLEDQAILAALPGGAPQYYGNAQFVLDPEGRRRGPIDDGSYMMHPWLYSPFHESSNMCGTCHEVGNVAVSKQPNGTYRYNAIDAATPSEDPWTQFPLERTFTEFNLSTFGTPEGVDMGGRFHGTGDPVIASCQDCHMPEATGQACRYGPVRPDLPVHEFAGGAAQVLDLIQAFTVNDPTADHPAITRARANSVSMLERAATLQVSQTLAMLNVRVINETGHKLPTGHIEGRRVWINVRFLDAGGALVAERGGYNGTTADLVEANTRVYEMLVGLSPDAAAVTGLPVGVTGHMSVADTIEKDNRIPPRGFNNAMFAAGGAPAVGAVYADGQYWDDAPFRIPAGAVRADVTLNYQNTPKHYIEALRDGNTTDQWGNILYNLWQTTGKGAPIAMATAGLDLTPSCAGDFNGDGTRNVTDIFAYIGAWFGQAGHTGFGYTADFNSDGAVNVPDIFAFLAAWFAGCV